MGNKCEKHFCNEKEPNKHFPNWMKCLPDSSLLSSLTIPGTHNSCSLFGGVIAITQTWSIPLQLKAGIRYFDIRLRKYKDKLRLQHGVMNQKCTFDIILKHFKDFLTDQSSEVIIMAVQEEYQAKDCTKTMNELFEEYTREYHDLIVEYKGKDVPLNAIRGKILFINIFHSRVVWTPLFKTQNDWVVNTHKNIIEKTRKIKQLFNRAITLIDDGFIYVNYLSGVSDYGIITPARCAHDTNKKVFKFKGRLGIVLCDFPGEGLIEHLIDQNVSFSPAPMNRQIKLVNKLSISLIHVNTKKYLSLWSNNNVLICSKQKYDFTISIRNDTKRKVYDQDLIRLTSNDNSFEMEIVIIKKKDNDKEKKVIEIFKGDILYLIIKDKKKEKHYLSSDYSLKSKQIQKTHLLQNVDNSCEWIID